MFRLERPYGGKEPRFAGMVSRSLFSKKSLTMSEALAARFTAATASMVRVAGATPGRAVSRRICATAS
jgi:hypothetical protein